MIIRNVRPWGADAADIVIEGDRIAAISPHDEATAPASDHVDGRGRLIFPSFSDVHVHLDSSRIGLPFRPHTGAPGVWGMMLNDRDNWRHTDVPHAEIVAGTLERMIAKGTTRVRTLRAGRRRLQAREVRLGAGGEGEVPRPRRRADHDVPAGRHPARSRHRGLPRGIAQAGCRRHGRHRSEPARPRPGQAPGHRVRAGREVPGRGRHPLARAGRPRSLQHGARARAHACARHAGQGHDLPRLRPRLGVGGREPSSHRRVRRAGRRNGDRRPLDDGTPASGRPGRGRGACRPRRGRPARLLEPLRQLRHARPHLAARVRQRLPSRRPHRARARRRHRWAARRS